MKPIRYKYYFSTNDEVVSETYSLRKIERGDILNSYNYINNKCIAKVRNIFIDEMELFQGDIVHWEDYEGFGWEEVRTSGIAVLKYNEERYVDMFFDPYSGNWYDLDDFRFDGIEGNIYQNPIKFPDRN